MEVMNPNTEQRLWCPVNSASSPTIYSSSLVISKGDGIDLLAVASGVVDTNNKQVILGVALQTNDGAYTKQTDATTGVDKIVGMTSQAAQNARNFWGANRGPWVTNDPQPMVAVQLITAESILKAPLFNSTYGVAPTLLTTTVVSGTGVSFTSNACDFTPVLDKCTSYFRTGANAGLMRSSGDTSTTAETNAIAFPNTMVVGDQCIRVPLRPIGLSFAQIDSKAMFFDVSATPATNYFSIIVLGLDLRIAGQESVLFRFAPEHFVARA